MNKIGIPNKRYHIGICYVILPGNVDRDTYIQGCFRKGMVTVQFENGSFMNDVHIDIETLQNIDFPEATQQLGSALVYNNEYVHNKPMIIGRLLKGDETTNLSEKEFRFERYSQNGSVSISGKGKDGNLFIKVSATIDSLDTTKTRGNIFVDVINSNNEGNINLNVQGNINIELQNFNMNILNSSTIKAKSDINIDTDTEMNIGASDKVQATFRGNDTVTELKKEVQALTDLIQSIASIVPVSVVSGAPDATWTAWQATVAAITQRGSFDDVQSSKIFIE
jgi:hypothetical protein